MSCCNHFRDFLVLSSADLTRLTLVDSASGPAPVNKDNKNKTVLLLTVNQLSNTVVLFCQSRPRIVCCFDLLLRGRSLTFASSFRRFVTALLLRLANFLDFFFFFAQTHAQTDTQTERRSNFLVCLDSSSSCSHGLLRCRRGTALVELDLAARRKYGNFLRNTNTRETKLESVR